MVRPGLLHFFFNRQLTGWHVQTPLLGGPQARAADTGAYLMDRLRALQERFPCLGDVRGTGLMVGIEVRACANQGIKPPLT